MSALPFAKLQGAGNDFVLLDGLRQPLNAFDLPALARRLCGRRFGVGADGLLLVEPSHQADVRMRLFNADGSEASMCGNGIRCLAHYVWTRHAFPTNTLSVETPAGVRQVARIRDGLYTVAMGTPTVLSDPEWTLVNTGALHVVVFTDSLETFPLAERGHALQHHPRFPDGVNLSVAQVVHSDLVRARVWERGVGETLACGTGACAIVVAGTLSQRLARRATVEMLGGLLEVEWRADDTLWLTGDAVLVFEGAWRANGGDYSS
ncbi:MAG: diaminopimelate epimerase [Fimbriimonadales bacterium]|nr:diaminopimelate epimerase [Fimbriimonadales bacterium]MDW8051490.1 diaminopimelate epimerase [Armatimonadota bacterium]